MKSSKVNYYDNDVVNIGESNITKTSDYLEKGFYRLETITMGFLRQTVLKTFEPSIPKTAMDLASKIIDFEYLDTLFSDKSLTLHRDLSIRRKVGYLLHGKQGSGKTTTINAIAKTLIEKYDACIFIISSLEEMQSALKMIAAAKRLKDFVSAIIFDECEGDMRDYEHEMKGILDGLDTPDNVVFLCATNYIDKIPETIKNRPSRFKYVLDISKIGEPDIIFEIVKGMNTNISSEVQLSEARLRNLTEECLNSTMDEIKNKFIDACFMNLGLNENPEENVKKTSKMFSFLHSNNNY